MAQLCLWQRVDRSRGNYPPLPCHADPRACSFHAPFATPKRVRLFAGCKDQLRPCPTMLTIAAPICCGLPLMAGYDTWKARDPRSSRKSTGAWLQPLGGVTPPLAISASGATSQKIPGGIAQHRGPKMRHGRGDGRLDSRAQKTPKQIADTRCD